MDFFNGLSKKLGKTAKSVTKKSEELVEITKINLTIGNEEDKIKKLMLEMGNELYEKFAEGNCYDDSLNEKCTQVKAIHQTIAALKEKINSLKGQNACADCSTDCDANCSTEAKADEHNCSCCKNHEETE